MCFMYLKLKKQKPFTGRELTELGAFDPSKKINTLEQNLEKKTRLNLEPFYKNPKIYRQVPKLIQAQIIKL